MSLFNDASLIVTPNGYKEGKLYSIVPATGAGDLSVTRATTATRVNSAGLVELVPYNLLRYSKQFDNAAWSKIGSSATANTTTAPNGSLTADSLIPNTTNDQHRVDQTPTSTAGVQTFSVYVKAAGYNFLGLRIGLVGSMFNLTNGAASLTSVGCTASSESVGDGWYRCILTKTAGATNDVCRINVSDGTGFSANFVGDNVSGIYIWGAQLNEGTLKDYFATETRLNIPRLDYSNGSCPSILVEPQRTNLFTYSEQFDDASWTKLNTSVTANTTIAPSGLMTADTMAVSSSSSRVISANVLTAGTYTISVWAKVLSGSGIMRFNLTIDGTPTSSNFEPTTEWQRFTYTFTATTSVTTISFRGLTFVGDLAIWGAQLEQGAYPTSYIPTTSASVTRNADVISKSGISSLINSEEGVLFLELAALADLAGDYRLSINNGTHLQAITLRQVPSVSNQYQATNSNSSFNITFLVPNITHFNKIAIRYKLNAYSLFVNGALVYSSNLASVFPPNTLNKLSLDRGDGAAIYYGKIKQLQVFKTALSDAELIQLTTL